LSYAGPSHTAGRRSRARVVLRISVAHPEGCPRALGTRRDMPGTYPDVPGARIAAPQPGYA